MSPDELDRRAAELVGADGSGDLASLERLAGQLVDEVTTFGEALHALRRAVGARPRGEARTVDLTTRLPEPLARAASWRDGPGLVPVDLVLQPDVQVEVELVPQAHLRLVQWRDRTGGATEPPLVTRLVVDRVEVDAPLVRLAIALRRWRIGVPFSAADVAVQAGATAGLIDAPRLHALAHRAALTAAEEVRSLPTEVARELPGLHAEASRWSRAASDHEAAAILGDLLRGLPALWDEPEPEDAWTPLFLRGEVGDIVVSGDADPSEVGLPSAHPERSLVPVSLSARAAELGLVGDRPLATVEAEPGRAIVRIPLLPMLHRRWTALLDDLELVASGPEDLLGATVASELAWWRLRSTARLRADRSWSDGELGLGLESLPDLGLVALGPDGEQEEVAVAFDRSDGELTAALPGHRSFDRVLLVPRHDGEQGLDDAVADAERQAAMRAWREAAEGYGAVAERLAVVASSPSDGPEDDSPDPPSERVVQLLVLALVRAASCWRRHGSSPVGVASQLEAERHASTLDERADALRPELAQSFRTHADRAGDSPTGARAAAELVRLRAVVTERLERLLDQQEAEALLADIREVGATLIAIDAALSTPHPTR